MAEHVPKRERVMREALKDAGETIAEYLQDEKPDAERVLHEIIGEVDNKTVAGALAESERADRADQPERQAANDDARMRLFRPASKSAKDSG